MNSFSNFGPTSLASAALTGNPTAPTAVPGTNTTQIATTAFVLANVAPTVYTQTSHGFSVGQAVRWSGTAWVLSQADTADHAVRDGIVASVTTHTFTLAEDGQQITTTGLTSGQIYFLSAATPGAYTATEPSTAGQESATVFKALSTTVAMVRLGRSATIGGSGLFLPLAGGIMSGDIAMAARKITGLDRIGIGVAASTTHPIATKNSVTTDASVYSLSNDLDISTTYNAARYHVGMYNTVREIVSSGVTNSGYVSGLNSDLLRAYKSGTDDSGTLSAIYGGRAILGHAYTNSTANPTTSAVYGSYEYCNILRGTIGAHYGLHLGVANTLTPPATWASTHVYALNAACKPIGANGYYYVCTVAGTSAGSEPSWGTSPGGTTSDGGVTWTTIVVPTITAEWGVYQASTAAQNWFAGRVIMASLAVGNSAAHSLGAYSGTSMQVYDASGNSLGYVPIYQ